MRERLLELFKRIFELENVDISISQQNCDKWDSLNHLNLIVEIETEFDISLEPEEIGEMIDFVAVESVVFDKLSK